MRAPGAAAVFGCLFLAGCAGLSEPGPAPSPEAGGPSKGSARAKPDPLVLAALLRVINEGQDKPAAIAPEPSAALDTLAAMGTPEGLRLWSRYTHIGVPLADAFKAADDPMIGDRVIEAARWARDPELRSAALLALAARHKAENRPVFEEQLIGIDPVLHFSLAEALEAWKRPEAAPLLERLALADASPVVRVYAAQALWRRGDPRGREELLRQLDGGEWLPRAMAARYLGLFGSGDDYNLLLDRLAREQANDFVVAEIAIAALRLFPSVAPGPPVQPPAAGARSPLPSDLEPLVVTAPRLKIPATALIDGRINAQLLRLLEEKAEERLASKGLVDPSLGTLASVVSPEGVQLKLRYSQLAFLLTEGLAGTTDLLLRDRIVKVAQSAENPRVRAAAMLALSYDGDARDRTLFEAGLASKDPSLRFAAVEAYGVWNKKTGFGELPQLTQLEDNEPLAAYAASQRIPVVRWIDDPDWVIRALAVRSAGRGTDLISRLATEPNPFVRAELCAALLR